MRVLVLNAGSSSLKAQYVEVGGDVAFDVTIERIGEGGGAPGDHGEAVASLLDRFEQGTPRPDAVGHRVVHGGDVLTAPTLLDGDALATIEDVVPLAPLHNPANLAGIRAAMDAFGEVPHVAVFDTAFHATMPPAAHRYAVPRQWSQAYGVRRYGFHGISHQYVAGRAAALLEQPLQQLKLVTAHLGNGQSVCAVDGGVSVDTSMGMGPLAGLVMGTRAGDLDPTVIFHLVREEGLTLDEVEHALQRDSGLKGMAGSNDLRDITARAADGDDDARLALDLMVHRLVGYLAAYAVRLGRLDGLVFTAGIGEHSALVRRRVCAGLGPLGVTLDEAANDAVDGDARIDAGTGPAVLVVATDEGGEIARQVAELLRERT